MRSKPQFVLQPVHNNISFAACIGACAQARGQDLLDIVEGEEVEELYKKKDRRQREGDFEAKTGNVWLGASAFEEAEAE